MPDGNDESHHAEMMEAIKKKCATIGHTFNEDEVVALFRELDKGEAALEELADNEDLASIRRQHELGIQAVDLLEKLSALIGFNFYEFINNREFDNYGAIDEAEPVA